MNQLIYLFFTFQQLNFQIKSHNYIKDQGAQELSSVILNWVNLSILTLNLNNNKISEKGISELASALGKCVSLSNLFLNIAGNNKRSVNFMFNLGSNLTKCKNLSSLNLQLYSTEFGNDNISELVSGLINCKNLLDLELNLGQKNFMSYYLLQCLSKQQKEVKKFKPRVHHTQVLLWQNALISQLYHFNLVTIILVLLVLKIQLLVQLTVLISQVQLSTSSIIKLMTRVYYIQVKLQQNVLKFLI
ncbi:hypothetical protein TTHERM_00467210 (macronuclear) [Tetrahymena thermophila SB210]|uniref:Uncharacterized protein n=1 Tax=Tetrahymena thermophila (strain SB210) TaxID=312017 RepID=I7MIV0_TETTS|nr:hypothetical protein TTHERM_00467210 [Tetrahymena thermophila SB210]EAS04772.2 hypothetical protein TTHERM_00467210 [Tetrahymena thermophila SB210]|eukprot:XP_001025017.2 hypothetical protein TTHERM_00467210 [Tetrahymena thermophila SB210]